MKVRTVYGLICDYCDRDFQLPAYWGEGNPQGKFCSFDCREAYRTGRTRCSVCGCPRRLGVPCGCYGHKHKVETH